MTDMVHEPVTPLRAAAAAAWPAAAVIAVQLVAFPVPLGVTVQGVVLGLLNAMVVLGLVLVYRANRVINLAQASMGTFPAAVAGGVVLFGAPERGSRPAASPSWPARSCCSAPRACCGGR